MSSLRLLFAILALCVFGHSVGHSHKCVHNELMQNFKHSEIDTHPHDSTGKRILQAPPTLRNLRIRVDYSDADIFINSNPSLLSLYQMSRRILENTKLYFQTYLQVKSTDTMSISPTQCPGNNVYTKQVTNEAIDLYVIISAQNNGSTSYFAAAGQCAVDSTTSRPIAGVYFLNFANMKGTSMYEYFYFTTFTHEFMHILFFSATLFPSYRQADGTFYTTPVQDRTVGTRVFKQLTYPNLVAFAKTFYKCTTLTGVPLEDGGGSGTAGSHWEKLFLPEDVMNPTIENPARISPFTIELIKSSGWYAVLGDMAMYYDWGKDKGCVLDQAACPSSFEYCPAGANLTKNICSTDYLAKSTCSNLTDYFNGCLLKRKMEVSCILDLPNEINMGAEEIYGPHARCISWEKKSNPEETSAECHAVRCINGELQFKLKSNITKVCRYEGEKIVFPGDWQINCPNPKRVCQNFANRCPMDCYGTNGVCLNGGKCFCFNGFTGPDCGTCTNCKKITDPFILSSNLSGKWIEVDALNLTMNFSNLLPWTLALSLLSFCNYLM